MVQKYGFRATEAIKDKETFTCIVCETKSPSFNWSDLHGEGMCNICGVPYQIVQYEKLEDGKSGDRLDIPPKCNMKDTWIPAIKKCWEENHKYLGLGQIMIYRDYPKCLEGRKFFDEWCKNNKDILPKSK